MQISCPQCATSYELDDRLLPPSGAPVQCTRCSHVFNAAPPKRDGGITQIPGAGSSPARSTQIFGAANESQSREPALARSSNTRIFGVGAESPAPEPAPARPARTQIFAGAAQAPASVPKGTQIFGAPASQGGTSKDETPTIAGGPLPGSAGPRSTRLFAATEAPAAPAPHEEPMFGPPPSSHDAPTLLGGPLPGFMPDDSSRITADFSLPSDAQKEAPGSSLHGGRRMTGAVSRSLEPFSPPAALDEPSIGELDDLGVALQASRARRRNLVLGALGVGVLVLAGYSGLRAWSNRPKLPSSEAVTAHSQAVVELRRDDAASIQSAADAFAALVKKYPDYLDARASYLTALLFQLDDVRMEIDRIEQRSTQLGAEIARFNEKKSPSDWQNRVNALVDQRGQLQKQRDPLVDRATLLDAQVNTVFAELQSHVPAHPTPEQELQLIRAQAVYFGVKGADEAIKLSERYKLKGGTEGWDAIAYAEYALNTKVAPETRRQAQEALEAVKAQDASFVRLHVLIGRLALAANSTDGAANALDAAVTLNPKHEGAQRLLKQIEQQKTALDLR